MKISYNWLKELTGLDWPVEEMGERLTLSGTACEDIIPTARYMDKVVVGEVTDLRAIEGADKIKLATVNTGSERMDLVCGAPNVAVGQKVPVALLGAELNGGIVIKKAGTTVFLVEEVKPEFLTIMEESLGAARENEDSEGEAEESCPKEEPSGENEAVEEAPAKKRGRKKKTEEEA